MSELPNSFLTNLSVLVLSLAALLVAGVVASRRFSESYGERLKLEMSLWWMATICDFPIERFRTDADLAGDKFNSPFSGEGCRRSTRGSRHRV